MADDSGLFFKKGGFACERKWLGGLYRRDDNTFFFNACIVFQIQRLLPYFNEEQQSIALSIVQDMEKSHLLYRNKDGHSSYNFWQTNPSQHFPGGYLARHLKFFMIPDDIDDSALVHLSFEHSIAERESLFQKAATYAIGTLKLPDLPVKGYEHLFPFNTFFVKNMPAAFDVCALSNFLYFVMKYRLPHNNHVRDSIACIALCIKQKDYLKRPYEVSPYYPKTALIIYHITRILSDWNISELEGFKHSFINDILVLLEEAKQNSVHHLLLHICLLRLGITPKYLITNISDKDKKDFAFFVAGILGEVKPIWLRSMAHYGITHITYHCSAYAEMLWIEYLCLLRSQQSK